LIKNSLGKNILLKEVADIKIGPASNMIKRENNSRRIDVEANLNTRDLSEISSEIRKIISNIYLPTEYHVEFLGEFKEQQKAQSQILFAGLFSTLAIFLLLQLLFNS
jgi:Cu/Ag efflux pump CusA